MTKEVLLITQMGNAYFEQINPFDTVQRALRDGSFHGVPHLGIGILYSELVQEGYKPSIAALSKKGTEALERHRGLVLISAIDRGVDDALEIIRANPDLGGRVVIGGQGITPIANRLAGEYPNIAVYSGRADFDVQRLTTDYDNGTLAGLYCNQNKVNLGGYCAHPSLDEQATYRVHPIFNRSLIKPIEMTSGCSQNCEFCPIAGERISKKDMATVIKEIEMMKLRPSDILLFVDHNLFNLNKRELNNLFDYLNSRKIKWAGEGTIAQIADDEQLLEKMGKHCVSFLAGLEDLDANYAGSPAKTRLVDNFDKILQQIRRYKIPISWSMVMGLDTHDEETFLRMAEFIDEHKLNVNLHIIQPRSGSKFQQQLIEEGRMTETDSRARDRCHLVYKPTLMSREKALAGCMWLKQHVGLTAVERWVANAANMGILKSSTLAGIELLADGLSGMRMAKLYSELAKEVTWFEQKYRSRTGVGA